MGNTMGEILPILLIIILFYYDDPLFFLSLAYGI